MQASHSTIYLNIGGFFIKIHFRKADNIFFQKKIKEEISKQYEKFIVSKPRKTDFSIEFVEKKHLSSIIRKKIDYLMYHKRVNSRKIESYYHISLAQIDLLIKKVIFFLLRGKGFILHASATNVKESAYIFTGKPTAGKSTAMKLLNEKYPSLADDSVIIRKENGRFYAYQTPYIEKEHWITRSKEKYIIGKLFFLRKTPFFKMLKLTDKEYIIHTLSSQFLMESPHMIKQVNILFEFVSQLDQCFILSFAKKKKRFIDFVEKQ